MEKSRAPCPHEARVGERLRGKWRLERLLGVGGTAAVYAAQHRNGMRGAVKILHAELKHNHESRGRFLYEGVVANRVIHDGIVAVLDDDVTEDGTPFLVMELLEGEAVDERMDRSKDGRLGVGDTCCIISRLLDVLAAAHRAGVIHRDVKPENVFITGDGCIKLLDFGVAHVDECPSKAVVTRFGYTLGTPAFMPPEQATGDWVNMGPATDLWAVGASMYNMLTGSLVHGEAAVYRLLQRTATEPAPAIRDKMPELSEAIAAVVDKALAFEIKDRFQSANEMRDALEAAYPGCIAGLRLPASPDARTEPSRPRLMLTLSPTRTTRAAWPRRTMALVAGAFSCAVFAAGLLASGSSVVMSGDGEEEGVRRAAGPGAHEPDHAREAAGEEEPMTPSGDPMLGLLDQGPPAPHEGPGIPAEPASPRTEPPSGSAPADVAPAKAERPSRVYRAFRSRL